MGNITGDPSGTVATVIAREICEATKDKPNTPIDIVGFSRGSAIANEVSWELSRGCPCGDGPEWRSSGGPGRKVRFLDLFDTVHSMGLVFALPFGGMARPDNFAWHTQEVAPNVRNVAHANALDEHRSEFRYPNLRPSSSQTNYTNEWFRGVHSDVGGYSDPPGTPNAITFNPILSAIALVGADVSMDTAGLITDEQIAAAAARGQLHTTPDTLPSWVGTTFGPLTKVRAEALTIGR